MNNVPGYETLSSTDSPEVQLELLILVPELKGVAAEVALACGCGAANGCGAGGSCQCGSENGCGA